MAALVTRPPNLQNYRDTTPADRYQDLPDDVLQRVVTAADVQDGRIEEYGQIDVSEIADTPDFTQPGDVLVTTMHTIRSGMDESGGRLPSTGVFRLRISKSEVLLPNYLSIALMGSWNTANMVGTTIQRAAVRDLEIPMLQVDEQQTVVQTMQAVQRLEALANRLVQGTVQFQESLLEALRFGVSLDADPLKLVRPIHSGDIGSGGNS